MRSFRARAHGSRLGYVGYLQMSSSAESYARYVLHKLLDSLEKPYDAPDVQMTGLLVLSDAVLTATARQDAREALASEDLDDDALVELCAELADGLLVRHPEGRFDIDVLRALLLLQRRDPRLNGRVMKYLRCEPLNPRDQRLLGELAPKTDADDPARMLVQLGRVIYALAGAALVLLVDQLEDVYSQEDSSARFRRAMDVMRALADAVPSAVIVVACLDDFYTEARGALSRSVLDRIEHDPDPVHLTTSRTREDIEALVSRRLQHLYERQGARFRDDEPYFPFTAADFQRLSNLRTRDVLDWFRRHQERCMRAGALVDTTATHPELPAPEALPTVLGLEERWSDLLAEARHDVPEDDESLAALLSWALEALGREIDLSVAAHHDGRFVTVTASGAAATSLMLGVSNREARGGGLARQVSEVEERAARAGCAPAIVRCSAYPASPNTKIARQLGKLIASGGHRVVVEDSDWRTMLALRELAETPPEGFDTWCREARPLARIEAIRQLMPVDELRPRAAPSPRDRGAPEPPSSRRLSVPPEAAPAPSPPLIANGALLVGTTRSLAPAPVTLEPSVLKRHAAFLGSTGSGKTTFMLHLLEGMLERGVPCLLVDRKGDLVTYAQPAFWARSETEPERAAQKRVLAERLDVHVYTPGEPNGRDLGLPIVPSALGELPVHEKSQLARQAADGLGAMMNYKQGQSDLARLGILSKAIEMLGELGGTVTPTIEALANLIGSEDPALVNAIGHIDTKHFKRLAENLSTLQLGTRGRLLASQGETLDIDRLLGTDGSSPKGRTRLAIVSTKFLEDLPSVDFWVSRLILELRRWANRRPAKSELPQALVLFDEADIYLPALRIPAAKEPLMDLLKRGRSAGVGVLLATQSPGDLDYKGRDNINTWMLGRIAEKTALAKLKPLLSESRIDVSAKLANAGVGEFIMLEGGKVTELRAMRSLMDTEQLSEDEILRLAAHGRPR